MASPRAALAEKDNHRRGTRHVPAENQAALALLSAAVFAAGARAQPTPPDPPLLGLPTFGFRACALPTGTYVFTNEGPWLSFWRAGSAAPRAPRGLRPVADRRRRPRPRPNAGYAVHFTDYCRQGEELVVRYEEWLPGPGTVWAACATCPFDIAAIPAGGPVRFERCFGPHQGVMTPVARRLQVRPRLSGRARSLHAGAVRGLPDAGILEPVLVRARAGTGPRGAL